MTGLRNDMLPFIAAPQSAELIRHYLHDGHFTGGRFDTYATRRIEPDQITGDDLTAVTLLAIRVTLRGKADIRPKHILGIEDHAHVLSGLLRQLPVDRPLHTLAEKEFERLLGERGPGTELFWLLRNDIGLPRVATYKLLARKRPHLLAVRDTKVEKALHPREDDWWRPWWEELHNRPDLVTRLEALRKEADAAHLSLLRIVDVCVWMWEHGVDTDGFCPDLRQRVGPAPPPGRLGQALIRPTNSHRAA